MAEAKKKRRVVRTAKPETMRERAAKNAESKPKARRIRRTAAKANKPLAGIGRIIAKIFRPFGFVLWPFKTRPARAAGRFLAKVLLLNYIRSSWQELKQVQWPNRRQTTQLTFAVFAFAFALTGIVASADWILNKLFKELLLK